MESLFSAKNFWFIAIIAFSIIGVEYLFSKITKRGYYRFQNTVSNISTGAFDRLFALFLTPFAYGLFKTVQENYGLIDIPFNAWTWILSFFLFDLMWYVYHMLGHRVNVLWGAHIIHHQSEDFNYTVPLSITPFQSIIRYSIWMVLPFIGFPAEMVIANTVLNGAYQFFLHTQFVPKLGPIEWVFVTPSHHRVHHGANPEYIDKNYGGILIIWDRMFGTYAEEKAPVVFGVTKSIKSRQFFTHQFHYWYDLWQRSKQLDNFPDKVRLFFKGPEWEPKDKHLVSADLYVDKGKYDYQHLSYNLRAYITTQMIFTMGVLSYIAYNFASFKPNIQLLAVVIVLNTLVSAGAFLEKRGYAVYSEFVKFILLNVFIGSLYHDNINFTAIFGMSFAISTGFILWVSTQYDELREVTWHHHTH